MSLEQELETFEAKLPELRAAHEGKYALVRGTDVVGVFATFKDAVKAGYERFGLTPFFVNRIGPLERLVLVPRLIRQD